MARSTRQQRRLRRAQAAGTPPLRPAPRPRPTAEEEPRPEQSEPKREQRRDDVRGGIWGVRFLQESWAELNKVEWPNQQQVISGTAVVIIACLIVGTYLWLNDQLWQYLVQHLLLR
ncbi:MAG TPA: preprotein translocase subunit SecE [Gaiellaceae bacterium]|jgi:preprotein translocase SecE subunit|nr:preprotein translocase subunit SecE [Gaiellaceae bacterium]